MEYELREITRALYDLLEAIDPLLDDQDHDTVQPVTVEECRKLNECVSKARETLAIWAYIRDLEEDLRLRGPLQ